MNYNPLPAIPRITHAPKKSNHPVGRTVAVQACLCLTCLEYPKTDFLSKGLNME